MKKKRAIIDGEDVPFWNFLTGRKLVKGIVFPDTPRVPTQPVAFDADKIRINNPTIPDPVCKLDYCYCAKGNNFGGKPSPTCFHVTGIRHELK